MKLQPFPQEYILGIISGEKINGVQEMGALKKGGRRPSTNI
jgi:hypothetical protein